MKNDYEVVLACKTCGEPIVVTAHGGCISAEEGDPICHECQLAYPALAGDALPIARKVSMP